MFVRGNYHYNTGLKFCGMHHMKKSRCVKNKILLGKWLLMTLFRKYASMFIHMIQRKKMAHSLKSVGENHLILDMLGSTFSSLPVALNHSYWEYREICFHDLGNPKTRNAEITKLKIEHSSHSLTMSFKLCVLFILNGRSSVAVGDWFL